MAAQTQQSAQLPTGTVTFPFTDIEGSTSAWIRNPTAMRAALARHDALIETTVTQHAGQVVRPRGEGDSRFAVFARATDGVAAASAIQVALAYEVWPMEAPLRVRIALHTGEADLRTGDYYGPAVNHCARLRAVAHGAQVLVSSVTAGLVRESLATGISLRDLGEHQLKDLELPEHVFQLVHPNLQTEFPPLSSVRSVERGHGFGKLLRRFRLAAALTQEALAEKAGLSVRGLSDLERGLRNAPHPDSVRRLANALDLHGEERAALAALALTPGVESNAAESTPAPGSIPNFGTPMVRNVATGGSSWKIADRPRSFGSMLRERRMAAGFSQDELSQRTGLSRRGIADLERGARNFPYGDTVRRIAEALDLPSAESAALLAAGQRSEQAGSVNRYVLPTDASPLFGREEVLSELQLVLKSGRVVTLTGPGGIGKTRLGLEVARRVEADYDNGAVFVDLAPVTNPTQVALAAAVALGVREEGNKPLLETVQDHLGVRQVLVVLDNCEHLLDASAQLVDALVRHCPEVRVLATSREPLRISAERAWPVPPLRPDGAFQLFVERARATQPTLDLMPADNAAITEICQRLDGIALAIELAAARVPALALPQIAARLSERLRLLSGGGRLDSPRHQTLRAAIDWSYELLSARERHLFEQLAVFAGGWDLTAAEDVCTTPMLASSDVLDVLAALVDKSLVVAERGAAQMRYRLLETIREYASERLAASGRASEVRRRHMAHYRALVEGGALTRRGVRYAKDFDVLKRERDNTRAALTASLALGDLEDGLALCQGLAGFWLSQGFLNEGQGWFERFLDSAVDINWETLVESLFAAGRLAEYRGAFDVARGLHQRSLSVARQHDDVARTARALNGLGDTALHQGDYEEAARCLDEGISLGRRVAISSDLAEALAVLATIADARGEHDRARLHLEEALQIQRRLGDAWGIAFVLNELGQRARRQGQLERAQEMLEESQVLWRQSGSRMGERAALMNLALTSLERGAVASAAAFARGSLDICQEMAEASATTARCVEIAAQVLQACGRSEVAIGLFATATVQRIELGAPIPSNEEPERERTLKAARESLVDAVAFQQAWDRGVGLTIEQAVGLAADVLLVVVEPHPG